MKAPPALLRPVSPHPSLRALAFSVAAATIGVGLMYQFLLPQLQRAAEPTPGLTGIAIAAGGWWFLAAVACAGLVSWLMRRGAGTVNLRLARGLLQLLLLIDVLMVGLCLAGLHASIVALPGSF